MERRELSVSIRNQSGKTFARRLRRQGLIPAILYGPQLNSTPVSINLPQLKKNLRKGWENVLFDLTIGGNDESQTKTFILKELQVDPVNKEPLHVDFYEVTMDRPITIEVPIEVIGTAPGVKEGGLLQSLKRSVLVECLPSDIPDSIKIDVGDLDIGDSVRVSDIHLNQGVKVLDDSDVVLVAVQPPVVEKEEVKEEVEEEVKEEVKEEAKEIATEKKEMKEDQSKKGGGQESLDNK